jgi:serine/threonine protein phosphatase PrpC
MAAQCESAGRPNNEDNYQIGANLNDEQWSFTTDEEVELSPKGALLVVADGMGGMNAGEVASAIAVDTIKEWFSPSSLTGDVLSDSQSVIKHIREAIQAADAAIKKEGNTDKEKRGMGSTIALAWLVNQSVYVGWCGDSRVYRFNPADGLVQLSHDHSYVQDLVDAGKLDADLAFDHPENNIITRSLGDTRSKANPDTAVFPLRDGDIFLLCSDGLCGVLRDPEIEQAIAGNTESLAAVRSALWETSYQAGWDDNVTLALCQILSGSETPALVPVPEEEAETEETKKAEETEETKTEGLKNELIITEAITKKPPRKSRLPLYIVLFLLLAAGATYIYHFHRETVQQYWQILYDSIIHSSSEE